MVIRSKKFFFAIGSVFLGFSIFIFVSYTFGFEGPTKDPPSSIGQTDNAGAILKVDKKRNVFIGPTDDTEDASNTLTITPSDSNTSNFSLLISNPDRDQILRYRNDGVLGISNIVLKDPDDFTNSSDPPINSKDSYPLQVESLYNPSDIGIKVNPPYTGGLPPTSDTHIYTNNWQASSTNPVIEGLKIVDYNKIINFASIEAADFNVVVSASQTNPGVFSANKIQGPFSFGKGGSRIGVSTSTNSAIPENLSVYGNLYAAGVNSGIGVYPPSFPAALNIASANTWVTNRFTKAIRIDDTSSDPYNLGMKASAIEFGGGSGGTLYGVSWDNLFQVFGLTTGPNLHFFNASEEVYGIPTFPTNGLVIGKDTMAAGTTPHPEAVLAVSGISGRDAMHVGRGSAASSIIPPSNILSLALNSTSTGKLYLNNFTDGDIIIKPNLGNVGINTSLPSAKLDILTKFKTQTIQITGGSPKEGELLAALDPGGGTGWISPPLPLASTAGATLYHNGSGWATSTNLYNNNSSVGIGTVVPKGKLDVAGSISGGAYAGVYTPPANSFITTGNIGAGTSFPAARVEIANPDGDSNDVILRGNGGSVKIFFADGAGTGSQACTGEAYGAICLGTWTGAGALYGSGCWNDFSGLALALCAAFND